MLLDRYLDSSVVYQGIARGLGLDEVLELNLLAVGGLLPDRTFVLAIEPDHSLGRVGEGPDRIEREDAAFHADVAEGYERLAALCSRSESCSSTARSTPTRSRPGSRMSFADLPEQPEARRLLASAVAEGPAHAYLLHGPAGVGKRAAARAFAAALLGEERRVQAGTHPDLFTLEALGEMIRIDEIRALHRDLHMRPYEADRRVYLIFDAHLLNEDAADALLKDLEEPPPYAVIVLVADELGPLPPTILSRCQLVPFRRLSEKAVRAYLAERAPGLSETEARSLARVAGGRLDRAERLLDPDARSRRDELLRLARGTYADPELRAGRGGRVAARGRARTRCGGEGAGRRGARADRAAGARGGAASPPRAARRGARRAARVARGARLVVPRPRRRRGGRRAGGRPRRPDRRAPRGRDARARPSTPRPRPRSLEASGGSSRSSTSTRRSRSRRCSSACSARSPASSRFEAIIRARVKTPLPGVAGRRRPAKTGLTWLPSRP